MQKNIGRYHIEGKLAGDAHATLYLARDPKLGADARVVVKTLAPELATNAELCERFTQVAKEIKEHLAHNGSGCLPIFEVEKEGTLPYLVMPYQPDLQTLHQYLGGTAQSLTKPIKILDALANTLANLRAQNKNSYNLDPENVFLDKKGQPIIALFSTKLLLAEKTPPASDVYALGKVAWQMLTGQVLSAEAEPVLPSDLRGKLPQGTEAVLQKALAKLPAEQYATGQDFVAALRALSQERERLVGWPFLLGVFFCLLVALAAIAMIWLQSTAPTTFSATATADPISPSVTASSSPTNPMSATAGVTTSPTEVTGHTLTPEVLTPTASGTSKPIVTSSPTPTASSTPILTSTRTGTPFGGTATATTSAPTKTSTPKVTSTATPPNLTPPTPTPTNTRTPTATRTATPTRAAVSTSPTPSPTGTRFIFTLTPTRTPTWTPTGLPTSTWTATNPPPPPPTWTATSPPPTDTATSPPPPDTPTATVIFTPPTPIP